MTVISTIDLLTEALVLHRSGNAAEAAARYASVLHAEPNNADAHYYLGLISCQQGRFAEGADRARKSLANDPRYVRAHVLLGRALCALARREDALVSFERAIVLAPDLAEAYGHRGDVLSELGRNAEAIESYDQALALAPHVIENWFNRGIALIAMGRHEDAVASFERVIESNENYPDAFLNKGNSLANLKLYNEALVAYERALTLNPDLVEAWLGRGHALAELKEYGNATRAYDQALALNPSLAGAWLGHGNLSARTGEYPNALAAYNNALSLQPDLAEAWLGRGNIHYQKKEFDAATMDYDRALKLKPDLVKAWLARGDLLALLRRYEDACASYDRALALMPDFAEAWLYRGNMLTELQRYHEAFAALDKAYQIKPDLDCLAGLRIHVKQHLCHWGDLTAETAQLLKMIDEQKRASAPFHLLAITSSPVDQLRCTRRFLQDQLEFSPIWRGDVYSHERIRVAYLSGDFREHAVAYLMAGLFEHHDKSRFEVTALSLGSDLNSPTRNRIEAAVEHFVELRSENDSDIASLIRRCEIDILVDLMGFTERSRLGVLARRPAPVQVNYLGYSGTMGAKYIDFILADSVVIPEEQCAYYSERVVWLPDCYLINDDRRQISERTPSRPECGLPENAFVFCCFNNSYKLAPEIFKLWMRLLKTVPASVLWLSGTNITAQANLRREAEQAGVSGQRLVFAPRIPDVADHLARQRNADLFLDTSPYNAHTTACDALWVGLPVLTYLGSTFVGRVAASLLRAVGLDELITRSFQEYEAMALKLARNPSYLASIKDRLAYNRKSCPLFDTERKTRQIEAAYTTMWDRFKYAHVEDELAKSRPILIT